MHSITHIFMTRWIELRKSIAFQKFSDLCVMGCLNPPGYRLRPELGDGIRSCACGHCVVFFDFDPDAVVMVRILHGARDIPVVFIVDAE